MPARAPSSSAAPTGALSFVQDRATWHDMSQGAVQQTGNPLDVAIDGDAFLVVQTPRGERYTRNGALQINATGELVTSDGDQVLGDNGPICSQPTDRDIVISTDGTITVREGASTNRLGARQAAARRASPTPQRLQKDGSSTVRAPAGVTPQAAAPSVRVVQGAIEKSNVRGVVEMTRMIEVTRTYTADRQHPAAAERPAPHCDRAARRSPGLTRAIRRHCHARTPHRRDRNDGPGTQRPGHLQQHRQHAHDRLQAPARRIPGPALRARAPRRHADLGLRATSCRPASSSAPASRPSARRA